MVDALAIGLASAAARFGAGPAAARGVTTVGFDLLTFLVLRHRGFYRFRLRASMLDELAQLLAATTTAAAVVIAVRVLLSPEPDVGGQTIRLWAFVTTYLAVGRTALSWQIRRAQYRRSGALPTLIVGAGHVGSLVARRLLEQPRFGLCPIGFLDDDVPADHDSRLALPVLGPGSDLERQVELHGVAHVVVCFSSVPHEALLNLVRRARALHLGVSLVPRLFEEVTSRVDVGHLGGIPLLQIEQSDPRGWQFAVKYALDRVIALLLLIVLAPLLGAIALAVRLNSPGPVIYRQRRLGLDGQEFDILKFRTMVDSPEAAEEPDATVAAAMLREQSPMLSGDRRTPLGRWLRRLSLDELPQLVNVLRGEMSLIGPRPERPSLANSFQSHVYRYGDRHRVKSGITGWAQVNGLRGKTSLAERVEWDNYYIENWSPWLDLKIALLTIPSLIRGRNAE